MARCRLRLLLHHGQDRVAPGGDDLERLEGDLLEAHGPAASLEEPDVVLREIEVLVADRREAHVPEQVAKLHQRVLAQVRPPVSRVLHDAVVNAEVYGPPGT